MFQRRLVLSFMLVAVFAAIYGAVGWWIAHEAEQRILRGRLAGDITNTFYYLEDGRMAMATWAAGRVDSGAKPDVNEAEFILRAGAALSARLSDLRALAAEAERLDMGAASTATLHADRRARLDAIEPQIVALRRATAALAFGETPDITVLGLQPAGRLEVAMRAAITAERAETNRERAAADLSLQQLRMLSITSAIGFITVCIGLAIHLIQHLSRPLRDLSLAIAQLESGNLRHQIRDLRADEFGRLGAALNRMARELSISQDEQERLRLSLEDQIAERTRELTETIAALEASERIRRQLLADVGHELRSPITVVRGEAEIALRGGRKTAENYRGALSRIADATRQMGALIEDLLILSRDETEALPMHDGPTCLPTILEEMVAQAGTLAGMRGVSLRLEQPLVPGVMRGDALRLRQVIGILLDNALRYSHPGGTVIATTSAQDGLWQLTIADRGIGIPADEMDGVFDRGFRGTEARRHRADGSGLGLPIARRLARLHGGDVTLSPNPGGGTRAELTLPLTPMQVSSDNEGERAA